MTVSVRVCARVYKPAFFWDSEPTDTSDLSGNLKPTIFRQEAMAGLMWSSPRPVSWDLNR